MCFRLLIVLFTFDSGMFYLSFFQGCNLGKMGSTNNLYIGICSSVYGTKLLKQAY